MGKSKTGDYYVKKGRNWTFPGLAAAINKLAMREQGGSLGLREAARLAGCSTTTITKGIEVVDKMGELTAENWDTVFGPSQTGKKTVLTGVLEQHLADTLRMFIRSGSWSKISVRSEKFI